MREKNEDRNWISLFPWRILFIVYDFPNMLLVVAGDVYLQKYLKGWDPGKSPGRKLLFIITLLLWDILLGVKFWNIMIWVKPFISNMLKAVFKLFR